MRHTAKRDRTRQDFIAFKAEKSICMNKQDLRVSANNLESIVLQSEHFLSHTVFLVAFGVGALSGAWREVAESSSPAVKSIVRSHKIPLAGRVSEVAACAPLAVAVCFLLLFLDCFSWTHQVF
jgi:hypothetical protein